MPITIAATMIIVIGCAPLLTTPPTAPVSQVLSDLDLMVLSTAPFLCEADPDCDFYQIVGSGMYEEGVIASLYGDSRSPKLIPADCSAFEWKKDPRKNASLDEWANSREIFDHSLDYDPRYKVDTIVVDLKTITTNNISSKNGVVLADKDESFSLTSGQSRSQKRIKTDQRKITFKPKKAADMFDRYLKAYRHIYENDKNKTFPKLAPFYGKYLLKPQPLATEIICALETYLAHDYVAAQSELELAFTFQLTDTTTDENEVNLKIFKLSISGGTTNEAIDDRTHTITIKVKTAEAPDRSDAESIVRALYARWKRANNSGLDQLSLFRFTNAFVSNVSKESSRTAVNPYLWEAFQLAASVYVANYKESFDEDRLPKCEILAESWPFCVPADFASRFNAARRDSAQTATLEALLKAMPKGGELHSHLSGAVSVEELLRIAKLKGYQLAFALNGLDFCGFAYGNLPRKGIDPILAPEGCPAPPSTYEKFSYVEGVAGAARLKSVHDVLTVDHGENDGEPSDFKQFQRAFDALDKLTDNPDNMGDLVASVMTGAYENGVSYLELMFNPIGRKRFGQINGAPAEIDVPIAETLDIVAQAVDRTNTDLRARWHTERRYLPPGTKNGEWPSSWPQPVEVRVIVQGRRDRFARDGASAGSNKIGGLTIPDIECPANSNCPSRLEQGYYLAAKRYRNLVVGIDLVGLPEVDFRDKRPPRTAAVPPVVAVPLEIALTKLRIKYGDAPLKLHAGETLDPARYHHIAEAVELGAQRLGHAFALAKDPAAQKAVCEERTPLEISLTSNFQLNLITEINKHPFPDFYKGKTCGQEGEYFPVTLNTDDAGIFQTNMSKEFVLAVKTFELTWDETKQLALNSLQYGFMSPNDKAALIDRWQEEISALEKSWKW